MTDYEDSLQAAAKRVADSLPPLSPEKTSHLRFLLGTDSTYVAPLPAPPPKRAVTPDDKGKQCAPDPASRPPRRIVSGVYFIRSGNMIKIGTSTNVAQRFAGLRTMSPLPMELLAVIDGTHTEERALHERFAELRQHGEWFRAEPALLDYISEVTAQAASTA